MEAEPFRLLALPPALQRRILALAPVDARARAAAVNRSLRALLADMLTDPSVWTRLDLSDTSGVTCSVNIEVLRLVVARAGGALHTLNVSRKGTAIRSCELMDVMTSIGGTLRELRAEQPLHALKPADYITALLRAAPELHTLQTSLSCDVRQALPLLRNVAPYGPLRLSWLCVSPVNSESAEASVASFVALAAALPTHGSLRSLMLFGVHLESKGACDALVDAVLGTQLVSLCFTQCVCAPEFAHALARLLRQCPVTLSRLVLSSKRGAGLMSLLSEPAVSATLADALRENRTLTSLEVTMARDSTDLGIAVLLNSLEGHPTLQTLLCQGCASELSDAVGAAFGRLIAANASTLTSLRSCTLLSNGLGPLCAALPHNTHLRCLELSTEIVEASAAEHLLLAVKANRSLRQLIASHTSAGVIAAIQLVNERAAAEAAAAGA
jgi:hypothetical protein